MRSQSQVSHSGHPLLMPPFTTFISLSYLSKTLSHVYIHYSIPIFIPQRRLFGPQPTGSFIYPSLSPTPPFSLFLHYLWTHFATIDTPHHYISYTTGFSIPQTLDYPISCPCPSLSPCPPFLLF